MIGTNKVRGVQEGDEHYVDPRSFGAARAEEARKAKQPELIRQAAPVQAGGAGPTA